MMATTIINSISVNPEYREFGAIQAPPRQLKLILRRYEQYPYQNQLGGFDRIPVARVTKIVTNLTRVDGFVSRFMAIPRR